MIISPRSWIGLALGDHSIAAAEVFASGARCELRRAAEFRFPEGLSWREPELLGKELGRFLRQNHFSARRAVLGLPAKWLMIRPANLPPAGPESAAGILRIQSEREFSWGLDELALDFAGETSAVEPRSVLLAATPREKIDQALAAARAAGLRPRSACPTAMALSVAAASPPEGGPLLHLGAEGAELVVRSGRQFRAFAHVGDAGDSEDGATRVAEAVRRVLMLLPSAEAGAAVEALCVWDGAAASPALADRLAQRLPLPIDRAQGLPALGVTRTPFPEESVALPFAAAAALALAGRRGLLPVDFLHSRLALARPAGRRRKVGWAAALGIALVVAVVLLVLDWRRESADIEELNARLTAGKPDLDAARRFVDRASLAEGWFDKRPPVLDCLRDITLAFPAQGSIWATSLALRGDMRGIVSGEAVDQKSVLEVVDALKASRSFTEAKPLYMRSSAGRRSEVSFAISFAYKSPESKSGPVPAR